MLKLFSTATLFGLLSISAAYAESSQAVQADIPFAFTIHNSVLPAGSYRLSSAGSVLTIRGLDPNAESALTIARPELDPQGMRGHARLVFQCSGKQCYLAQVWQGGTAEGKVVQLPKTASERKLSFVTRVISMTMVK